MTNNEKHDQLTFQNPTTRYVQIDPPVQSQEAPAWTATWIPAPIWARRPTAAPGAWRAARP